MVFAIILMYIFSYYIIHKGNAERVRRHVFDLFNNPFLYGTTRLFIMIIQRCMRVLIGRTWGRQFFELVTNAVRSATYFKNVLPTWLNKFGSVIFTYMSYDKEHPRRTDIL